ncbi:hypothetical protein MMC24_000002 [Lignoscripta atroalba]|nr:hypothetical protein [Lignoscripta atroalba]
MADPILSDLCKICHINPPSGVRNPAAYMKRSEIATPKGIDQDYNFISGIERRLDTADRDATSRGVLIHEDDGRKLHVGPKKGEVNMRNATEKAGVIIQRAPKGMSRSKQNKTQWSKKQRCISWTIEWVHPDGNRELGTCLASQMLSEAYRKHKERSQPPTKKRKRKSKEPPVPDVATRNTEDPKLQPLPSTEPTTTTSIAPAPPSPLANSSPGTHPTTSIPPPTLNTTLTNPSSSSSPSPSDTSFPPPSINFYLHLPRIPSPLPTLLPLPLQSTLSTALQNRLILEFPTIHVLPYTPDDLPNNLYTLAKEAAGGQEGQLREMLMDLSREMDEGESVGVDATRNEKESQVKAAGEIEARDVEQDAPPTEGILDEETIREVLKKDLSALFVAS